MNRFLTTVAALTLALSAPAGAATMFRSDPQGSGVVAAATPWRLAGVRFTIRMNAPVRSSPVVDGGVLYVAATDGTLAAFGAPTGTEHWRFKAGGAITATPAVAGGLVLIPSRDGHLYGLDAKTGARRWSLAFGADLGPRNYWDFYQSSPVVVGARAFVGGGDGKLYALELQTGRVAWTFDAKARIRSTPAVASGLVIFGSQSGHVIAVDQGSGQERWRFATAGASRKFEDKQNDTTSVYASPTIADGVVAIGGRDGQLYGLDLATGAQKWRTTHDGSSWILSTAAQGGRLYIGSGSAGIVQAADLATGKEAWKFSTHTATFGSPILAGDEMIFETFTGDLTALDRRTGEVQWRFPLGARSFSTPAVSGQTVYAAGDNGVVYALDATDETAGPAQAPVERYVYWQPKRSPNAFSWFLGDLDQAVFATFRASGYTPIDDEGLADLFKRQADGPLRSVVVFADGRLPGFAIDPADAAAPLRRYMEAGGRVVFLGRSPIGVVSDKAGAQVGIDDEVDTAVTGVASPPLENERGYHVSLPTAEGRRIGLRDGFATNGAVAADQVGTVLARNEFGLASAWIKSYGDKGGALYDLPVAPQGTTDLGPYVIAIEKGLSW